MKRKCGNCGEPLKKTTYDMVTAAPYYCKVCGIPYNEDGTEFDDSVKERLVKAPDGTKLPIKAPNDVADFMEKLGREVVDSDELQHKDELDTDWRKRWITKGRKG